MGDHAVKMWKNRFPGLGVGGWGWLNRLPAGWKGGGGKVVGGRWFRRDNQNFLALWTVDSCPRKGA